MKININDFSKQTLVDIVLAAKEKGVLPEEFLAQLLRMDLISRVNVAVKEMEVLGPKIEAQSGKLTFKSPKQKIQAHNRMVVKYNRLNKSGLGKMKKIEAIEAVWPELKAGGAADGQKTNS